jgi:hypothetical protein
MGDGSKALGRSAQKILVTLRSTPTKSMSDDWLGSHDRCLLLVNRKESAAQRHPQPPPQHPSPPPENVWDLADEPLA